MFIEIPITTTPPTPQNSALWAGDGECVEEAADIEEVEEDVMIKICDWVFVDKGRDENGHIEKVHSAVRIEIRGATLEIGMKDIDWAEHQAVSIEGFDVEFTNGRIEIFIEVGEKIDVAGWFGSKG